MGTSLLMRIRALWDVTAECFRVFFGSYMVESHWREVGQNIFVSVIENGMLIYRLPVTGHGNSDAIRTVLERDPMNFFVRRRISFRSSGEKVVLLHGGMGGGASAYLDISKRDGWEFRVPPNLLFGAPYSEMEKRWDSIVMEVTRIVLSHAL